MSLLLVELPAHQRMRLVEALNTGLLGHPPSPVVLRSQLGLGDQTEDVVQALAELAAKGITGRAAAAWIESVAKATGHRPAPHLVWSGPEVEGLHARDTRRVYEELLGGASESLWVSTFTYFDGPKAFDVLATRMDQVPGLKTTLLLNIQRKRGDTTKPEDLVLQFAHRFWSKDWPGKRRPRVYYDPRSLEPDGPTGVLHAKAVVADQEAVFLTSANLTEAALDNNIEMGLLVKDRPLAQSIILHFQVLVERNMLMLLPGG